MTDVHNTSRLTSFSQNEWAELAAPGKTYNERDRFLATMLPLSKATKQLRSGMSVVRPTAAQIYVRSNVSY
jgi:hypothetical protein